MVDHWIGVYPFCKFGKEFLYFSQRFVVDIDPIDCDVYQDTTVLLRKAPC